MHTSTHTHAHTAPHPTPHTPHTHTHTVTLHAFAHAHPRHTTLACPHLPPPTPTWPLQLYDRVRAYYSLLSLQPEEVLRAAAERPMKYGYADWMALLQVPG